uniref:non-specific serine/threonine protein kinase n=1 Tax=Camelus bactrianus TaxID=9837 RepID=A0A9W3HG97_CAMBA|nr:serine/threonine-protein kinase LATS2 [Camelus bactrianus]
MRPKTFPATTYSGNSRQRLQEIREGLKQPSKPTAPGPPGGPGSDAALDAKVLGGKDAARQQQQQMRSALKFGPYQKALREIRYSLLPFANESGPSAAAEVNRQMLQELVDAGCDQEMAGRALKQTGSRSIEAALEFISKMGYLEPGKEQIVRVVKQTSPGKGLAPTSVPRRPSFEGAGDPFPPYPQMSGAAYEGPAALEEAPRQYSDFLFAGAGPHCGPGRQHQPKGYEVRVMRPEPQTAVGPSHPAWVPAPPPAGESLASKDEHPLTLGGASAHPLDVEYGGTEARGRPPPYPKHLLLQSRPEQSDVDRLCAGVEQGLLGGQATEPPDRADKGQKGAKGEKTGKDKKQIQTSPVPVRRGSRAEEKRESRVKSYSPCAFKFFMEQHVENVLKTHQQKVARRLQLEQEMAKAGLCEAEQEQMRKILYQKESNYNRLKRAKMDKSMFVKIKTLGVGAFGEVCLACKVDTHALYAMKTLRKRDVLSRNQVAHVKAERDILAEADNEWVVKLYYSFQDKDSLYFVMDYIPGGDMMSLLIRMEVFPEHLARFYIAELTLAIESVHRMGFIHRDIKPDNILIDLDGHIKLTDFGLCTGFRWTHNSKYYQKGTHTRQDSMEPSDLWDDVSSCRCGDRLKTLEQRARRQHQRCLAHSLVGTPNYIAPEVLLRKGYTQLCDWWSVGVILFEMLVGQPPFLAPTPTETQLKVVNWESTLHIPAQAELSPEARDLIAKLCCSAEHRLGRNGAADLKAHPFLGAVDFSSDIRRQPAPYVPKISHPMDTSNFDPVDEEGPWQAGSEDSTKAWDALASPGGRHPEHAFYEFTFRRFFDDNGHPFRCPKPAGPGAEAEGCQPVLAT